MQKILITINTSWNIYHFRASLIKALSDSGYHVYTAAPDDVFTPRLSTISMQHYSLNMQNSGTSIFADLKLLCQYWRLLRRLKPDIVLAYTIKPNIYATIAAGMLGIPVINNVSGLGTAFIQKNWLTGLVQCLYRLAFRFSRCVFFQNRHDEALFIQQRLVDGNKTRLLPGSGIDLNRVQPRPMEEQHIGTCRFLLVARMLWDKGIGEYVDAARQVKSLYPTAQFDLLGPVGVENKTAIAPETIEGWQKEGVIDYLGESDNAPDIMSQYDCIVLPSYREGMSRVLLEAAAIGRPVIASDVPGCKDAVEEGKNGFLCEVKNADALAEAMRKMIELSAQQRADMGRFARKKAEREYDESIIIQAYLQAITRIIANPKN